MEVCLVAEIGDVDHEGIPLPVADRITSIEPDVRRQMRAIRDRNDPGVTGSLADVVVEGHGIWRLHQLHHAAERPGTKDDWDTVTEAALGTSAIFRAVGAVDAIQVVVG